MKNFCIFFFFSLWLSFSFAQQNIDWVALPQNKGSRASVRFQSSEGAIIAELSLAKKYVISKDNGKTWQDIIFPSKFVKYFYFTNDDQKGILCCGENKVLKLDFSNNEFKPFMTLDANTWVANILFKNDKIYIGSATGVKIFDAKTLQFISGSLKYNWSYVKMFLSSNKNENYVVAGKDYNFLNTYQFDDETATLTLQNDSIPYNVSILQSGLFVYAENGDLFSSSDQGKTWKSFASDKKVIDFKVNQRGDIFITTQHNNKKFVSFDEGKTWEEFFYPTETQPYYYTWFENPESQLIFENTKCETGLLYFSKDKGKTWTTESFLIDKPSAAEILFTPKENLLLRNCYFIDEIKEKNTNQWQTIVAQDSIRLNSSNLIMLPSGKWLIKNVYDDKIYSSSDEGKSWAEFKNLPPLEKNQGIFGLLCNQKKELFYKYYTKKIDPNKEPTFTYGYYFSNDEGLNWEKIDFTGLEDYDFNSVNVLSLNKNNNLFFISSLTAGVIYRLNVYDKKTKQVKEISEINGTYLQGKTLPVVLKNEKLCLADYDYTGTSSYVKLYFSSDFGATFTTKKVKVGVSVYFLQLLVGEDNSLIILTDKDILVSYDEGDTWASIKGNLPANLPLNAMALSKDNHLYITLKGASVYKTKMPLPKMVANQERRPQSLEIKISPNPADDFITIQIAENESVTSTISVFSIEGKLLQSQPFLEKNITLTTSHLPKGMYLLQVNCEGKILTKKFIKN